MFDRWFRPSRERRFRRAKYAAWFDALDRDGDGAITIADVDATAERLRDHYGWAEDHPAYVHLQEAGGRFWATIVGEADRARDQDVQRDEFAAFLGWAVEEKGRTGALPEAARLWIPSLFNVLDVDQSGRVIPEEYGLFLQSMGSEADAFAAFERLDLDGEGTLTLAELEQLFEEWVVAGDPDARGNVLMTGALPG